jgi:hypothetical protein
MCGRCIRQYGGGCGKSAVPPGTRHYRPGTRAGSFGHLLRITLWSLNIAMENHLNLNRQSWQSSINGSFSLAKLNYKRVSPLDPNVLVECLGQDFKDPFSLQHFFGLC